MGERMFTFQRLNVYQNARELVKHVYLMLDKFPGKEMYALCDQLRRAVISVPSNIAEGLSRRSNKEQVHFIEIAYGSLMEVLCQIELSTDLGYITSEEYAQTDEKIEIIARQLSGLRNSLSSNSKG